MPETMKLLGSTKNKITNDKKTCDSLRNDGSGISPL